MTKRGRRKEGVVSTRGTGTRFARVYPTERERKNKRKRRMEEYKEGARRLQRKRLDSNYHRQSDRERLQVQLDARKARGRRTSG